MELSGRGGGRLPVFSLDYDGTLTTSRSGLPHSSSSATSLLTLEPSGQVRGLGGGEKGDRQGGLSSLRPAAVPPHAQVLTVFQALAADPRSM